MSNAKWLIEIATNPNFKINLHTYSAIVGVQKGKNIGRDIIFALKSFITRVMKIESPFYKEALRCLSIFERKKGIPKPQDWDKENIFYNPSIRSKSGKTIKETEYFKRNRIYKLEQLLNEVSKEARGLPSDKKTS